MADLVWMVWLNFVNEDDLKRHLVPTKVAKASIELHLGTIPSRVGVGSGSGVLGQNEFDRKLRWELSPKYFWSKLILVKKNGKDNLVEKKNLVKNLGQENFVEIFFPK